MKAAWGHVDLSFIFQVAVPLWTFPRFRGSLFCEFPPPLLPLTEVTGSLNLASGSSGKPGEGREAELASWTRYFGTTGESGGHPDLGGEGGLTGMVSVTRMNASWTWFITVVFIMASRWHQEKWNPCSAGGQTLEETAT